MAELDDGAGIMFFLLQQQKLFSVISATSVVNKGGETCMCG